MENYKIQFSTKDEYNFIFDTISSKLWTGSIPIRIINKDSFMDYGFFFLYWNPKKPTEMLLLIRGRSNHHGNMNDWICQIPDKPFVHLTCSEFLGMTRIRVIENIIK